MRSLEEGRNLLTRSSPLLIAPLKSLLSSCPLPESLMEHKSGALVMPLVSRKPLHFTHCILGTEELAAACGGRSHGAEGRLKDDELPIHAKRRAADAGACIFFLSKHPLRIFPGDVQAEDRCGWQGIRRFPRQSTTWGPWRGRPPRARPGDDMLQDF